MRKAFMNVTVSANGPMNFKTGQLNRGPFNGGIRARVGNKHEGQTGFESLMRGRGERALFEGINRDLASTVQHESRSRLLELRASNS